MKGLSVLAFLALSFFTLGEGLDCNYCTLSERGFCKTMDIIRRTTCTDGVQQCGTVAISIGGFWLGSRLMCLTTQQCQQSPTIEQTSMTSINMSCCNQPLCNAAPTISPLSVLPVAGILSLWMLKRV